MNFEEMNIEELWPYFQDGNEEAYEELYRRFEPLINAESKIHGRINEELRQDIYERLFLIIQKEISKIQE